MKIRRKLYCKCAFVKYSGDGKPLCIGISSFIFNSAEEVNPTFNLSKAVEIINLREGT